MNDLHRNVLDVAIDDIILHLTDLVKDAPPDEVEEFTARLNAAKELNGMTLGEVAAPVYDDFDTWSAEHPFNDDDTRRSYARVAFDAARMVHEDVSLTGSLVAAGEALDKLRKALVAASPEDRERYLEHARRLGAPPVGPIALSQEEHDWLYEDFLDTCCDVLEELRGGGWSKAEVFQRLKDIRDSETPTHRIILVEGKQITE